MKRRTGRAVTGVRVGFFGLLGQGNIGNDASLEVVLAHVRKAHPDAVLDAMATGPQWLEDTYLLDATQLYWHHRKESQSSGVSAVALKVLGKAVDTYRTVVWVHRHDVVIVPGMGALEATLPIRPWETPFTMFLLSISGRVLRTRVVFLSVGANRVKQRATRWLFGAAAHLAAYRSYRDRFSWEAMRERRVGTPEDRIFPDLVFARPSPDLEEIDARLVGVGLMGYYGSNDDRARSEQVHVAYVEKMKRFVRWLVDHDRRVQLLVGDDSDQVVVDEILADIEAARPDRGRGWVAAAPVASIDDLEVAMVPARTVIASRYHNVLCALKLQKPTISIGYAEKSAVLMADAGLARYCQTVKGLDVDLLIEQFVHLESHADQLLPGLAQRAETNARLLEDQFNELSAIIRSSGG